MKERKLPKERYPRVNLPSFPNKEFPAKTLVSTTQFTSNYDPFGGATVNSVTRGVVNLGNNSISRINDPNWKVKVAKKQDATNPYSSVKNEGRALTIAGETLTKLSGPSRVYQSRGYLTFAPFATVPVWTDAGLKDLALKRLKAKLHDNIGVFDAVVPVVELRELRKGCVSLIASALDVQNRLAHGSANLKRKAKRPNRSTPRFGGKTSRAAIADAWLQWSFGIKPILNDIKNANDAISTFLTASDHIVRLEAGSMLSRNATLKNTGTTGLHGALVTSFESGIERLIYKYVGSFDLKVKSSNDYSAENVFGLDPSSIIPTLYELTPYSWLIDYFTSVGDFLNDTFELPPGSLIYLSVTEVQIRQATSYAIYAPSAGTIVAKQSCQPGYRGYKRVNRTKLTALPRLGLRVKTLDEVGRNGLNKLANLLSVLKSAHSESALKIKRRF